MKSGLHPAARNIILPGATVGVLGSGQLGRMFAIAARRMGYRVHTLSPDDDTPTGQVADREVQAAYDDLDRIREFARDVDVVTFEFENVPSATAQAAAELAPVRPSGQVLYTTQNRLREKTWLSQSGFPVVPFRRVTSQAELIPALAELGYPAVLKTAGWGYDGKGQSKIKSPAEAPAAWQTLATDEAVLEAFIDFEGELSVVAARGLDGGAGRLWRAGQCACQPYPGRDNGPGRGAAASGAEAVALARGVLEKLDVVGVLCVEFFLARDGRLLINELAPRPHNSGHLTFDANVTSQFEQQLRAICGLPLGSTELLRPAAMANLLGDLWQSGEPDWHAALRHPQVKLHLYGKLSARPGRKMGHLTALAETVEEARTLVLAARTAAAPIPVT